MSKQEFLGVSVPAFCNLVHSIVYSSVHMHVPQQLAPFMRAGGTSTASTSISPASTIPACDEEARAMAVAGTRASKSNGTPEDKIRTLPQSPRPPLSRAIQSQEILVPTATPSTRAQPKKNGKSKTGKTRTKKKKTKMISKTTKRKKTARKGRRGPVKKTPPVGTKKSTEKAPVVPAHDPSNPVEPTPLALLASARPEVLALARASSIPAPAVKVETVKQEDANPPPTALAGVATSKGSISPETPGPESVASLLNRAQTTEHFDLARMQEWVASSVKAALDSPSTPAPGTELPKVRSRNKESHNRRMRFYRSLDSRLD